MSTQTKAIVWGQNHNLDPQTITRNARDALIFAALLGSVAYALTYFILSKVTPTETSATGFLWHLFRGEYTYENLSPNLIMRGGYSLLAMLAGAVFGFVIGFRPTSRIRHIVGNKFLDGEEATKMALKLNRKEIAKFGQGIALNQSLFFSKNEEVSHSLTIGGVGSGKSVTASHLLQSIFDQNKCALIVDWKGDAVEKYQGVLFNPLDKRSYAWAVALDVLTELDAIAFSNMIIPEPFGSGSDPFWRNASIGVLTTLVIKLQQTKPKAWNFIDLYMEAASTLENMQDACKNYYPHALQNIAEAGKQSQGVVSQIVSQMDGIRVLAASERDNPTAKRFSINHFLAQKMGKNNQLIVVGNVEYSSICKGWMSAIITLTAIKLQAKTDSTKRRVYFMLDEFPKVGKLPAIIDLIAFGRSKGASVNLVCQSTEQLAEIYGQNTKEALLTMFTTLIICRTQGGKSANYLSEQLIKTRTVERTNVTTQGVANRSVGSQKDEILVVHPSQFSTELGVRGDGVNAMILRTDIRTNKDGSEDSQGYVLNLKWNFLKRAKIRNAFELRDCFKGVDRSKLKTVTTSTVIQNPAKTIEQEASEELGGALIAHQFAPIIEPTVGLLLEGLDLLNVTLTPTTNNLATVITSQKSVNLEKDQDHEQE